jgi:hypothetical protein
MSGDADQAPGDAPQDHEKNVGKAVQHLREDLPKNFILLYEKEDAPGSISLQVVSHCSLAAAQSLLDYGIRMISDQHAIGVARRSVENKA